MGNSVRKRAASSVRVERCQNPWNGQCRSTDIELYIMHRGKQLPICRRCWSMLAEKPVEWGDSSLAKTLGR